MRKKRDPLSIAVQVALIVALLVFVSWAFGPESLIYVVGVVAVWRLSRWLARRLGWGFTPTAENLAKANDEYLAKRQRSGSRDDVPGA
jgi:hypothetical protein